MVAGTTMISYKEGCTILPSKGVGKILFKTMRWLQKCTDDGTARQIFVYCDRSPASSDAPTVCRRFFCVMCARAEFATGRSGERRAASYPPKSTPFCAALILLRMGAPRPS